jgi:glucokinase
MRKVAGIDVGGTYVKFGVVTTPPDVQQFKSVPTERDNLVKQLVAIVQELGVEALGVGVPGLVRSGTVLSSPNFPEARDLKLQEILQSSLKMPVRVENDAGMVAAGEWKYGAGSGADSLLLMTLGTGVGGGLILDGKLYVGAGVAGEVGHITIDPDGPPCTCGNYGCLESYVGSKAIALRVIQGIRIGVKTSLSQCEEITTEIISKEAYGGDAFARSAIETTGYYLGVGIASLCNVLDPDRVILGGGVAKAGEILFDSIREEVNRRLYQRNKVEIVPASLGDLAGVLGSAYSVSSLL